MIQVSQPHNHSKTCLANISRSTDPKITFSPPTWSYNLHRTYGDLKSFYFDNLRDMIFWEPAPIFSITGNYIAAKFGILLYLDTPPSTQTPHGLA